MGGGGGVGSYLHQALRFVRVVDIDIIEDLHDDILYCLQHEGKRRERERYTAVKRAGGQFFKRHKKIAR